MAHVLLSRRMFKVRFVHTVRDSASLLIASVLGANCDWYRARELAYDELPANRCKSDPSNNRKHVLIIFLKRVFITFRRKP